ncbi:CYTH and CHAD domain-containing protein [Stappia sp. F7233]|uniref:CYTH and CHAD domain-containing protein n=1 Tax=Stappia albiluteola TaxID=2758565 RepID=A0A839AGZ6_9HYPH|nr:CYTH and CHAD domain-containing protein [Stappia albiluteola]MBA5778961.1 CYTH and CHAD domain-containing protein [Stappia albiluteola]
MSNVTETELKIELDGDALRRLKRKALPQGFTSGQTVTRTLRSIYFDTPDQALKRAKWSLRVRRVGRNWVQTIKRGTGLSGGLSSPKETEVRVSGPMPDFARIGDPELVEQLNGLINGHDLVPQFETVIRRNARQISGEDGTSIELAIDSGEIVAGECRSEIGEAEFELKAGNPGQLFKLAKGLLNEHPVRFSGQSKAERGYRLASGGEDAKLSAPAPKTAGDVKLAADQDAGTALATILQSCLDQIAHNRIATLDLDDPEGPHQLRIGFRRLRSAIKVFAPLLDDKDLKRFNEQAQAIAAEVGALRDLDVLGAEIVAPPQAVMPAHVDATALLRTIGKARKTTRRKVRELLARPEINEFLFDLGGYAVAIEQATGSGSPLETPIGDFAAKALKKRWNKVKAYGTRIGELSIEERHEMRKALKKLRYTVEFFRSLYPQKAVKPFLEQLKVLQDVFGYLNDVAMAEHMVDLPKVKGVSKEDVALAKGFVIGWHEARAAQAWTNARGIWKKTAKANRFWS